MLLDNNSLPTGRRALLSERLEQATERERQLTTGNARQGQNATSGAEFATLPLVKPVVWFVHAVAPSQEKRCMTTLKTAVEQTKHEWTWSIKDSVKAWSLLVTQA